MKIAIAGIGYVGLANACLLALHNEVVLFDINKDKVNLINTLKSPIADELIEEYLNNKKVKLKATLNKIEAFKNTEFIIVATPTNYDEKQNYFDTSTVESVIHDVSKFSPKSVVIVKSTVPVGFTEKMRKEYPGIKIIFSPEFLREGKALYDNLYPSRIIIGDFSDSAKRFASLLLEGAKKKDTAVLFMQPTEAEAVKLFSNTYLALRVAYFNELDTYAELRNLNTESIIKGVCGDPRIGDFYNNPSFGYGGYCLPKDSKQLKANYKDVPENLISAIVDSNITRKEHIAHMILSKKPKTAGIYRLSMKTNSDNFRSSAIQDVMKLLRAEGITIIIFEPSIMDETYEGMTIINNLSDFKKKSDIIICNRKSKDLDDVKEKVYTRDLFIKD